MGSFSIKAAGNSLDVVCEGLFAPEDAKRFVTEFQKESKKVNPATCQLTLDGSKLSTSPAEMQEMLSGILNMYKQMGFRNVTIAFGGNAIAKMQVKRLAKEVGIDNFNVI